MASAHGPGPLMAAVNGPLGPSMVAVTGPPHYTWSAPQADSIQPPWIVWDQLWQLQMGRGLLVAAVADLGTYAASIASPRQSMAAVDGPPRLYMTAITSPPSKGQCLRNAVPGDETPLLLCF